ncbi:MAG: GIY-YIG nuclease family protein [Phocaeicola sp.]
MLKCNNTGLIKIGITGNLKRRLKTIGGSNTVLGFLELSNPRNLEKSLHKEY